MHIMENELSSYVKSVRAMAGLSQDKFAQAIQSNRAAIANYENNRAIPPGDVLLRIQNFATTLNLDKNRAAQEECPPTKGAVGKMSDHKIHRLRLLYLYSNLAHRIKARLKILMKSLGIFRRR